MWCKTSSRSCGHLHSGIAGSLFESHTYPALISCAMPIGVMICRGTSKNPLMIPNSHMAVFKLWNENLSSTSVESRRPITGTGISIGFASVLTKPYRLDLHMQVGIGRTTWNPADSHTSLAHVVLWTRSQISSIIDSFFGSKYS